MEKKLIGGSRKFYSVKTPFERFLLYISDSTHPGDCWLWEGIFSHNGYGRFRMTGGKRIPAHRYSFELFKGKIKKGLLVLHTCDNPPCVNPAHLWTGTTKQNMQDMSRKGRSYFQKHADKIIRPKGTSHHKCKLTENDVFEIRKLSKEGFSNRSLGKRFNVSEYTISPIILGKTWRHI
jgi:hypothetical protein